jgi:heme/copper-type cytochrome/quinol oxidase subunit 3
VTTTTAPVKAPPDAAVAAPRNMRGYETGWWGMVALIVTEAMIFAGLLAAYLFLRAASKEWPPPGIEPPELPKIIVFTVVLLGSSLPIFWAEAAIRRGDVRAMRVGLLLSFLLGLAFLVNLGIEYRELPFPWGENSYTSAFYTITGLHGLHVCVGLLINLVVQLKAALGRITEEHHLTVAVFSLYWHFVDVVWIFVFSTLYLSPHIR